MDAPRLLVLLLPGDELALAEDLLRARGVVAVEPPRITYRALARLPDALNAWLAFGQAGRLKLPGDIGAVCMFDPFQYALARGLLARHEGSELWYGRLREPAGARADGLDLLARQRAAFVFGAGDGEALWARLRELTPA